MLAKLTSKNQITIPKAIMNGLPPIDYFNVVLRDGTVVLEPVHVDGTTTESIRAKMRRLGLTEDSVADAVRWARDKP
ncbi:AbrB/MazE/SpoVT family DNA-binding domain-containing protein [Desulfonatronum sp. SC1]|uniref:AbrB/MazE/SpoVT family DNA-binding domain-containing protein n=1 Tax=Desulfonatronum sp. SC1 TaxID=2109626 RepID=UPI000D31AFCC|nr:AbrB/MazE/SpoVT family DNA-binding domain-containing protein [Desulfonatronum sp. SC1]PTN31538.1 AbrB family transcriptional regulator [Desulfonatronum sp. SC1]